MPRLAPFRGNGLNLIRRHLGAFFFAVLAVLVVLAVLAEEDFAPARVTRDLEVVLEVRGLVVTFLV